MVNKNIQMKSKNGDTWDNLFPLTLMENVFNNNGQNIDTLLTDFRNETTDYVDSKSPTVVALSDYDVDPTGETDSLQGFEEALNDLNDHEVLVLEQNAEYYLSDQLEIETDHNITIEGNGSLLRSNVDSPTNHEQGRGVSFKGINKGSTILFGGLGKGNPIVEVGSTNDIEVGDILHFQSDEFFADSREYFKKGGTFSVGEIKNNNKIVIDGSFPYDINDNAIVNIYSPVTVNINNLKIIGNNPLPAGYFGLSISYSHNSTINNVIVDNFNHCITLRYHTNTIVEHVRTMRAMFEGSSESYGLSSYAGTNLSINHSTFLSGRHALEISGFENSFKTSINHVTAKAEVDGVSFNCHQSSYDIVARNSIFDSVGLANNAMLENCTIGGSNMDKMIQSNIKTSMRYEYSQVSFLKCHFLGRVDFRVIDDAFTQPNNTNILGSVKFDHCRSTSVVKLVLNTSQNYSNEFILDEFIVRDSSNIAIESNNRIHKVLFDNSKFIFDHIMIQMLEGVINDLTIVNSTLGARYNLVRVGKFRKIHIDNCYIPPSFTNGVFNVKSHDSSDIPTGVVTVSNTDLRNLPISTGGFHRLNKINSNVIVGYGNGNITEKYETSMVSFE